MSTPYRRCRFCGLYTAVCRTLDCPDRNPCTACATSLGDCETSRDPCCTRCAIDSVGTHGPTTSNDVPS